MSTQVAVRQIQGIAAPTEADIGRKLRYDGQGVFSWISDALPQPPVVRAMSLTSPLAGDNVTMFYTSTPMQVSRIRAHIIGSTSSVAFNVRYGSNRSTAGAQMVQGGMVCVGDSNGLDQYNINLPNIPPESWVWITVSAVTGIVTLMHVTLLFD